MKRVLRKIIAIVCIFALTGATFVNANGMTTTSTITSTMDIIITEACIDDISRPEWIPTGASAFDPMEYVEIYNPTGSPINFTQDYSLYHFRTSANKEYSLPLYGQTGDVIVPAHSSIVLWGFLATRYTSASSDQIPTISDFRSAYGISDSVGVYQVNTTACVGFYNTYNGSFRIKDKSDELIAEAAYTPATDSADGKSIEFRMPSEGTTMLVYKQKVDPTPGQVSEEQYTPPIVPNQPIISNIAAKAAYTNDEPFTVSADITDCQKASVYVKQSNETAYLPMPMENHGDGTFSISIPRAKLWGETLTWYIEAYNDTKSAKSEENNSSIQYSYDSTKQPQVLMTELKTEDTGYNYLEFYNNSDHTINFAYYNVFYEYPSGLSYKRWPFNINALYVESGKTLVVWINDDGKTFDEFNTHYGVQLEENKSIIKVDFSGMSPDIERTIKIGNTYEKPIALATYHEDENDDTAKISSIHYTFNRDNGIRMIKADITSVPTPGTVQTWQVPSQRVPFDNYGGFSDDEGTMVLKPRDAVPETIEEGEALNVAFDCFDTATGINTIETYYKFDDEEQYCVKMEKTQRIAKQFITSIPASQFLGHKNVTFYIKGYNAFRSQDTQEYVVSIKPSIDTEGITLNVKDNQIISSNTSISAYTATTDQAISIKIDGQEQALEPILEGGAYFSYKDDNLTSYYKNAITVGDNVIKLLSSWANVNQEAAYIDNQLFDKKENGDYEVTVTLRAGSQGSPFEESADHASFTMSNMALYLTNGMFIYSDNGIEYQKQYTIGETSMTLEVHFTISKDQLNAKGVILDTTGLTEGEHVVKASVNESSKNVVVIADNVAPEVNFGIENGQTLESGDVISLQANDEASGIDDTKTEIMLDDKRINIPYTINSSNLKNGTHKLQASYTDYAGHTTQNSVEFITNITVPNAEINDNEQSRTVNLSVQVKDDKPVTVEFLEGKQFSLEQKNIKVNSGTGDYPLIDGGSDSLIASSSKSLPYQLFEVQTGDLADEDLIEADWKGSSNVDGTLQMFVLNVTENKWESIAAADQEQIKVSFKAKDHVKDGKATLLVQNRSQCSYPYTGNADGLNKLALDNEESPAWDGTGVPENYDFSFAWISDPQYYVESYPEHYTNMNQWILDNRNKYSIKYTINTGDLIDEWDRDEQWQIADKAQALLDDANMPNGVLAGNHDASSGNEQFDNYWKYFGEQRYKDNSYYGGSYRNNLGHYDLISSGGQDFIILYMSWDVYQEEVDWMNQILAKYPERKAIIAMHRYLKQGGTLDYAGELVQKEVVAKNKNIFAVINGHYFGAAIKIDGFDDNGDGVQERKVYQICTDYQGAAEGGLEYLKMIYFDLENNKIYMNAYSPYLKDFNYFDNPKLPSYDIGVTASSQDIYELDVLFNTNLKTLETTKLNIDVYKNHSIGKQENVTGEVNQVWENLTPITQYWWYAKITNEKGDSYRTPLKSVHTLPLVEDNTGGSGNSQGNSNSGGNGQSQEPTAPIKPDMQILVNGKAEAVGSAVTTKVMDKSVTTITVDDKKLEEILQKEGNNATVTIPFSAEVGVVQLNGQTIKNMESREAIIEIKMQNVIYTLPAALISIDNISLQMGTKLELKDIAVNIKISEASPEAVSVIEDTANKNNYQVVIKPVEFEITCTSGSKTAEVSKFSSYVERLIAIPENIDPKKITTGVVLNSDGTFSHVPTMVTVIDGKYYVKINSLTNSTYLAVESPKTFADVEDHWAKDIVNDMGSRLIVSGTDNGNFEPDRNITRAEFATVLVKALGLMRPGTGKAAFQDVKKDQWYYDAVSIANEYGIISGYENGDFGSLDQITREQAMGMIAKAMKITSLKVELKAGETEELLAAFGDSGQSAAGVKESIAVCIKAGIVLGKSGKTLAPKDEITRTEAAVMLQKLLKKSDLI